MITGRWNMGPRHKRVYARLRRAMRGDDSGDYFLSLAQKQRATAREEPPPADDVISAYFRLAMAVRSNLPVATKAAPHQLEPNPPGLIGVKLDVKVAVWSLVKALQSPLLRSVS
jgi:hypothetical protein